ncbi:TetR/AcrR family transcriptional regulator [Nocardioides sp. cx-173]|uniref:TetR/AcrR family transcriptional regulator n=1 Tax=Nocardioides sp. cx-173 TaxID=2898796 RepID=UPI001E2E7B20|nr:TetR/AcrR family transcriptional regulator [Nocardioides sp. cx-173]MCD4524444.1 TetR/AcrR family transcriptional regulator [Nocardioides sp. cx-173]UGB43070.1 TetR/AcrR family transcriptional regulator [Nocardioides sp. cx-173]
MTDVDTPSERAAQRPRVEGDREQEILEAALAALAEVGYDRLTMDAVAARARASKATLYRRWNDKASLVIDALMAQKDEFAAPDTGSLRGDLVASFCGIGGLTDTRQIGVVASVLTAISRDASFAEKFRADFIAPKAETSRLVYERAQARGELGPDVDVDLLATAVPGIVLHRLFLLGELPDEDLVTRVIDQIVLPAATCGAQSQPVTKEDS